MTVGERKLLPGPVLNAVAAAAVAFAIPSGSSAAQTASSTEARRLAGDWEPADAFVLAHEALWSEAVDRLLQVLPSRPIYLLVKPEARIRPSGRPDVVVLEAAHESAWVRDFGPMQVSDGGRWIWLDPEYYPDRPRDDALTGRLARALAASVQRLPLRLEGGAVASDGRGLCVITSASLERMGPIDDRLAAKRLGCRTVVTVPALQQEPTGHVDMIVHFLGPDVVGVAELAPEVDSEPDAARLDVAVRRLERAAARLGRTLKVVRVPAHRDPGDSFHSYLNVIPLEGRLLVPDFEAVPVDVQQRAYHTLRRVSRKQLVPVPSDAIALAGGGLHCIVLGLHVENQGGALSVTRRWAEEP